MRLGLREGRSKRSEGTTPPVGPQDSGPPDADASSGSTTTTTTTTTTTSTADGPTARTPATGTPASGTPAGPAGQPPPAKRGIRDLTGLLLIAAAHPRQALATSVGVGVVAALAGRPTREVGLVMLTVLVGQTVLGWHNDLVDRQRDARHGVPRKPVADGRLDPGTVWFAVACGVLLVVPLSVANGVTAGSAYLLALAVGLLGNVVLRKGLFSWLPWAAQFALYPAFVSYGGWGGDAMGNPPEIAMTVLAALLGVGVHFLRALWGLVPDNADGWTYLPLRAGLKLGASRLLLVVSVYCLLVVVALCVTGTYVGLEQ